MIHLQPKECSRHPGIEAIQMPLSSLRFSLMAALMVRIFFPACGFFLLPVTICRKPLELITRGIQPG